MTRAEISSQMQYGIDILREDDWKVRLGNPDSSKKMIRTGLDKLSVSHNQIM
jgi:hypothetical protein